MGPATTTLTCFAVESFGRIGKQAEHLLDQLAAHKAKRSDVLGVSVSTVKAKYKARVRAVVSVALQKAMSLRELGFLRLMRAHDEASVPRIEQLWMEGGWPARVEQ